MRLEKPASGPKYSDPSRYFDRIMTIACGVVNECGVKFT